MGFFGVRGVVGPRECPGFGEKGIVHGAWGRQCHDGDAATTIQATLLDQLPVRPAGQETGASLDGGPKRGEDLAEESKTKAWDPSALLRTVLDKVSVRL